MRKIKVNITLQVLMLVLCGTIAEKKFYDTFTGSTITKDQLKKYDKMNNTFWCAIEVEDCNVQEGRRLDGSCYNPKYPTRGATHTPFYRVLPGDYSTGFEPRKAKSGDELPLARKLRTSLLSEGRVPDQIFTQLLTYFWVFMSADIAALHDTVNYIEWTPYCCLPKGKTDPTCTPNAIPEDDPVFRYSDIRCLNMTRPMSFQTAGCVRNDTTPERVTTATPMLDLSNIYGSVLNLTLQLGRNFEGGLLKYEEENGRIWPPSAKIGVCRSNQMPHETRCHRTRRENMIRDNVINPTLGFRDFYDRNSIPQISFEFPYVLRWLHTVQESRIRMYDQQGHYLKEFPMVNLTLRTGYLAVDDNLVYITQGAFRQPMGKVDYIVDPDMVGVVLGPHQRASDVMTNDLAKGRYFGFSPYIKYIEFCSGRPVTSFHDLHDFIDPEARLLFN